MSHLAGKETSADSVRIIDEHFHSAQKVYPTGTGGVTVTGAAGAWTLGDFAEVVPVSTITEDFDLHWVNVEAISASGIYEIVFYQATTEIARKRFPVLGTPANLIMPPLRLQTVIIPANAQIQAKIMNAAGGGESATISLDYHLY
jgi:hypothetical protein